MLSPTAKQLESLLNDAESTCVVFGDSIFGLVFIAPMRMSEAVAESLSERASKHESDGAKGGEACCS